MKNIPGNSIFYAKRYHKIRSIFPYLRHDHGFLSSQAIFFPRPHQSLHSPKDSDSDQVPILSSTHHLSDIDSCLRDLASGQPSLARSYRMSRTVHLSSHPMPRRPQYPARRVQPPHSSITTLWMNSAMWTIRQIRLLSEGIGEQRAALEEVSEESGDG